MTQGFEQSLVQGRAHWITSVMHEPASSRLVILLTDNEGTFKPTRAVEFLDIQQLESRWSDQKDGEIEGLLGAHEEELEGLIHYLLVTDQREIALTTRTKAAIHAEPRGPAMAVHAATPAGLPKKLPRS
jgi:hypothetical protein